MIWQILAIALGAPAASTGIGLLWAAYRRHHPPPDPEPYMTRRITTHRCPGPCDTGMRRSGQYLCPDCWRSLPADAQTALYRRDSRALARYRELNAQLGAAVPLAQIHISP